jgi:hypothetical protein
MLLILSTVGAVVTGLVVTRFTDFPTHVTGNSIYLTKREENPTYLERAGDDLIGRVVTGILALVVGYLLGRHTK